LPNEFGNNKVEYRGYDIEACEVEVSDEVSVSTTSKLEVNDEETIIYRANPINQFNEFTAIAHEFKNKLQAGIFFSPSKFKELELQNGDKVQVEANNQTLELQAYEDNQINGNIAYVSTFLKNSSSEALFDTYRYNKAKVTKA
ncbi:MAG: ferredoxin, partial [Campylobacterota bacterium]